MYKLRKLKFYNHHILGNLELNFCDKNDHPVDTIILAGENGTGKTTILDALFSILTYKLDFEADLEIEINGEITNLNYRFKQLHGNKYINTNDNKGLDAHFNSDQVKEKYKIKCIYSDVDINFKTKQIDHVTSLELDDEDVSRRTFNNLATQINQLIIDIQALDDAKIAQYTKKYHDKTFDELNIDERMPRFTRAFNNIFNELHYSEVKNFEGHKLIVFKRGDTEIPIEQLSSGEKQIVYRGCFLLKDVNALNGALVFIDEPEISMHPSWQNKIMDFYKGIFTNDEGRQTSQIFAVTHSPFIIHNDNRKNDKVIVLYRVNTNEIKVSDKSEYYKCSSIEAVQDAFSIEDFLTSSTIYLEGKTDEMYFKKTLEVFNRSVPFKFKWIGYSENGQDKNSGSSALDKAKEFLISQNFSFKNVLLYDSDTRKEAFNKNNLYIKSIEYYNNSKNISKGVENALVLDDIDISSFINKQTKDNGYGSTNTIFQFDKVSFCNYLCALDNNTLSKILKNLNKEIDRLVELF